MMTLKEFMAARHMSSRRAPSLHRGMLHEINQAAWVEFEEGEPLAAKKDKLEAMFTALIRLNQESLDDLAKVTEP
jgi:hypothetical protein